jgi:TRAP-type C4-dicarboxylate transport system permease small subunit
VSHAIEPDVLATRSQRSVVENRFVGALGRAMAGLDRMLVVVCSVALVGASLILSYSVAVRYIFHEATYWQDEASVFLIVGATFLSAAHVQSRRGHVGIEAVVELLSPAANRIRFILVDIVSFAFCAFFAWKSWVLDHEAWVDGQVSSSTWGPPLWLPYTMMAIGMTLLSVQIALQIAATLTEREHP